MYADDLLRALMAPGLTKPGATELARAILGTPRADERAAMLPVIEATARALATELAPRDAELATLRQRCDGFARQIKRLLWVLIVLANAAIAAEVLSYAGGPRDAATRSAGQHPDPSLPNHEGHPR